MDRKSYSRAQRKSILDSHNNRCANCGSTKNLQIHHIVPIKNGGHETPSNLTVLCNSCHRNLHRAINSHNGVGCGGGRKPNPKCEDWEEVLLAYARCELSASEAKILLNMSSKTHIKDKNTKWAYDSLRNNGITDWNNKIDYYECAKTHRTLQDGDPIGYVVDENGSKHEIFYDSLKRKQWQIRVKLIMDANNMAERANTMIAEALKRNNK